MGRGYLQMKFNLIHFFYRIKPILICVILWWFLIYVLFFSDYQHRFENTALNYFTFILIGLAFPLSIALIAVIYTEGFGGWVLIAFAACASLPIGLAVLYTLFSIATLQDGIDVSYKKINELRITSDYYRVYLTNGGATTGFGLVVRREIPIATGLKFVKHIKGLDGSEGRLEQLSHSRIRLTYMRYTGEKRLAYDFNV